MIDLNELCNITLKNAEKRNANGGDICTKTRKMLQHCATEVVEAMEAYTAYDCADSEEAEYYHPKSKFSDELADIICCVLIIAGKEQIDIEQAINDCIEKNRKRAEKIGDKLWYTFWKF